MKNLKRLSLSILLVCIAMTGFAQDSNDKDREASKEKMAAFKIGYLTEKLALSEAEATIFWPIYNQEKEALKALKPEKGDKGEKVKLEDQSDAEIKKHIYEKFELSKKRIDIQEAYAAKYIDAIGAQKVAKLYKAEHDFKKEMLQKLKKGDGPGKDHPQKK